MAGYKHYIKKLKPVWLAGFDGEQWNTGSRFFVYPEIIDEMGNQDGLIEQETTDFAGYRAGIQPLVPLDHFNQYALRFCPTGSNYPALQAGHSRFPKAMITVPNNAAFDFSANEFTYCFMANSGDVQYLSSGQSNPLLWPQKQYNDVIFRHGGIISVVQRYGYLRPNQTYIHLHPFGTSWAATASDQNLMIPVRLTGRASWIVIRYKNFLLEVFVDGNLFMSKSYAGMIDPNNLTFDAGDKILTIGGQQTLYEASDPDSDRLSRTYDFDNFSVFNRALTDIELARLFRRIWDYETMIKIDSPNNLIKFKDDSVVRGWVWNDMIGNTTMQLRDMRIIGGVANLRTRQAGAYRGSQAIEFTNKAHLQSGTNPLIAINSNFTMMLRFKMLSTQRGILFKQMYETAPFEQVTVWCNSKNHENKPQSIELDLSATDVKIPIADNVPMDAWHHIIIRKTAHKYDIWFDGKQVVYGHVHDMFVAGSVGNTYMLAGQSYADHLPALLSDFVSYSYALSDMKVNAHLNYENVYRIKGHVTLMGNPTKAVVRVYSHETGELIDQTESDPYTGYYQLDLLSNERVDVFVFDREDDTIKFRAYGYLVPYEIDENPLNP